MKQSQASYKRIVVKVGSSLFCSAKKGLDTSFILGIGSEISALAKEGREIVLVSSGAIAFGMMLLGLKERPKELAILQAAAAVGQNELMDAYSESFKKNALTCAQLLLTWDDFSGRLRYLNAKNTLLTLLKLGAIPVVNENDTVSTDEIKFGDNDRLSALVASLIGADLLIILSDVDGLLDRDNKIIKIVTEITGTIKNLACPSAKKTCVGGMITKIDAAKIAVDSGIPCVIANGNKKNIILSVIKDPANSGTLFVPRESFLAARERWIAFGSKTKGAIVVDDGAKQALLDKKSLLAVGVNKIEGVFENGEIVAVKDKAGHEFARGKVNLSAKIIEKVKGERFAKEVIHRDNLVLL